MHPFIFSKHKEIMTEPVLNCGQQSTIGGCSSLPTPGERSDNEFSGPPSFLWSPWLELGVEKSDTSLQTQY